VRGVVLYMLIYMMMTLGSFACVIAMRRNGRAVEQIDDLAGLARTNRGLAFVFAMLMFSLAGIPPLAGFFAKYFVFLAAIKANLVALAVIGVLTSVVGAYYYLRIVKIMYFDEPAPRFDPAPLEINLVAAMMGLFMLGFVFIAQPLLVMAQAAAQSLF
jgi:NADH-quinone oxidoreductase subunit N